MLINFVLPSVGELDKYIFWLNIIHNLLTPLIYVFVLNSFSFVNVFSKLANIASPGCKYWTSDTSWETFASVITDIQNGPNQSLE